jgi:hypothetical protein
MSLALACERESVTSLRVENLESTLQAAKEEAAAAAAARNVLQKQMEEMMVQGRLKEV